MAAYAEPSDLISRYDVNIIGQLVTDDGLQVSESDLEDDAVLLEVLQTASGQVEASMLCGARYSPDDLSDLTGNSASYLKHIVCLIAMALLFERRPAVNSVHAETYLERATKYLEDLRHGKNLFNLEESIHDANPTVDGPSSVDYRSLNMMPDRMARYFPSRKQRLPITRG